MKLKYYKKYFFIMKQVGVTVNLKDIGHGLMVVHLLCWPAAQILHKKCVLQTDGSFSWKRWKQLTTHDGVSHLKGVFQT